MAIDRHHVHLVERGPSIVLTEEEWSSLEQDEGWTTFSDLKIVGVQASGAYRLLIPRQFVGTFRAQSWAISVDARHPAFFRELCAFVSRWPSKAVRARDKVRDASTTTPLSAEDAFLPACETAVQSGLPFLYSKHLVTTAHPRGRIHFRYTIRQLQSHGVRHKVVCEQTVRREDARLVRVIGTTKSVLRDRFLHGSPQRARLDLLDDIVETKALRLDEAVGVADELETEYSDWPEIRSLMSICRSVLSGDNEVWDVQQELVFGECRFCNMDRLWEVGVLRALEQPADARGLRAESHPYRRAGVFLFEDGGPEIDPDVVVFDKSRPVAVIDAKYSVAGQPSADDVYQIACYSSRLGSKLAVLVYLAEPGGAWFTNVGTTAEGTKCFAAGVPLDSIRTGLVSVAERITAETQRDNDGD